MSISGEDLGGALLWLAMGIGIIAAVAALAVGIARWRGSRTITLDATLAVAQVYVLLAGVGVVALIWRGLFSTDAWVSDMPIEMMWPTKLPFAPRSEAPELTAAVVSSANAMTANLSFGTRGILVVAELVGILVTAFPALAIVVLCRRARRGAPFARSVSRWLLITAGVVLVAGLSGDVLHAIGKTLASREVLPDPASGADVTAPWTFALTVPMWPVGAALVLAALAVVFRQGARLQRDTEGLV